MNTFIAHCKFYGVVNNMDLYCQLYKEKQNVHFVM